MIQELFGTKILTVEIKSDFGADAFPVGDLGTLMNSVPDFPAARDDSTVSILVRDLTESSPAL